MIVQALITTSGTTLLTVPAGQNYAVVNIAVCNYTSSARQIDIHIVKNGNTPGPTTTVVKQRVLEPYDSLFLSTEKFLLGAGDSVYMVVDADSAISATVSFIAI